MTQESGWVNDIIQAFRNLGGTASYDDLYPEIRRVREEKGFEWRPQSDAVVRGRIQENSSQTKSFKTRDIFYSVEGIGSGIWGLLPDYMPIDTTISPTSSAYHDGIEGILTEKKYLRRSRNPRLVEERKLRDDFTCQTCFYKKKTSGGQYIIDVHHLNPIGQVKDVVITKIDDLVCLCPNCHRIAHSRHEYPLSLEEIKKLLSKT